MSSKNFKKTSKTISYLIFTFFDFFIFIIVLKNFCRRKKVAELLDPNEIFFTPFEPKTKNRFIMEIDGIPFF